MLLIVLISQVVKFFDRNILTLTYMTHCCHQHGLSISFVVISSYQASDGSNFATQISCLQTAAIYQTAPYSKRNASKQKTTQKRKKGRKGKMRKNKTTKCSLPSPLLGGSEVTSYENPPPGFCFVRRSSTTGGDDTGEPSPTHLGPVF